MKRFIKLLLILIIVVCGAYTFKHRVLSYPYDVADDYHYSFDDSSAYIENAQLVNGQVRVSKPFDTLDTVFLKVRVHADLQGYFIQPKVHLTAATAKVVQSFEHGAKGVRYINISNLLLNGPKTIDIKGIGVDLPNQDITLIGFDAQVARGKRALVIGAVPADTVSAAFGLSTELGNVTFATLTAGDSGAYSLRSFYPDEMDMEAHYLQKGIVGSWLSVVAPQFSRSSGREAVNLGYFQNKLKEMYLNPHAETRAENTKLRDTGYYRRASSGFARVDWVDGHDWTSLVMNLERLIYTVQPDVIILPSPTVHQGEDRQMTSVATLQALRHLRYGQGDLLFYDISKSLGDAYESVTIPEKGVGESFMFKQVLSVDLSPNTQREKAFMLEMMSPLYRDVLLDSGLKGPKIAWRWLADYMNGRKSFTDLYVRQNELFYTLPMRDILNNDVYEGLLTSLSY